MINRATKESVEKKYDRKVAKLITKYQDRTMEELWAAMDKLKEKFKKEYTLAK